MKRDWIVKLVLAVAGLALLAFGMSELQTDPALRQLMPVSMAELEQGKPVPADQYVEVKDAFYLPYFQIEYSHSRKGGDHAHVWVPLGSQAMQAEAFGKKPVKPALWVRLSTDFRTKEAADAAMQQDALYERPHTLSGVVRALPSDVRSTMSRESGLVIESPLAFTDGSTPFSAGSAKGLIAGGILLLITLVVWVVNDLQAARWLEGLKSPGVSAYEGRSPLAYLALLGTLMWVAGGSFATTMWLGDSQREPALVLVVVALVGLALLVWGLLGSWRAALVSADGIELVSRKSTQKVLFADLTGILVDERKVKGVQISTYTLQGPSKPVTIGSSLHKGGFDQARELGLVLRDVLSARLGPQIERRIQSGEQVSFGPFLMSATGLSKAKSAGEVLSWAEVQSAELKNGQLKIKGKGKMFAWGSFAVAKLVNIDVLMYLLAQRGVKG